MRISVLWHGMTSGGEIVKQFYTISDAICKQVAPLSKISPVLINMILQQSSLRKINPDKCQVFL